jgi:meso-butanediol dehydrogenase/(S,S)-butanediol dehydrogenase/diacetyl reductase
MPLIEACVARFGGLDVLANIAGVGNSKSAHDTSDEDFEYWINANLSSTFRLCRDALPELRKRRGAILNMASGLAIVGMAKQAAYTSAKAGIAGLTRQMAAEYGPDGATSSSPRYATIRSSGCLRAIGAAAFDSTSATTST